MSQFISGEANKALVAILTTVAAALPVYFSDARWLSVVVMALGAIATYLVPNTPPAGTKDPSGM
jgi:hypothetical protein